MELLMPASRKQDSINSKSYLLRIMNLAIGFAYL